MHFDKLLTATAGATLASSVVIAAPRFDSLPPATGFTTSEARAVSDDGNTIAGLCAASPGSTSAGVWRFDPVDGSIKAVAFPNPPDSTFGVASAMSGDGAQLFGLTVGPGFSLRDHLWTTYSSTTVAPPIAGTNAQTSSGIVGASSDGSVYAVTIQTEPSPGAFEFSAVVVDDGIPTILTDTPGQSSVAFGVDGSGEWIVGTQRVDTSAGSDRQAFRWSASGGIERLEFSADATQVMSEARSISTDGTTIVGITSSGPNVVMFRWTESAGMTALGSIEGVPNSIGYAASGDGSIVVGTAFETSFQDGIAILWTSGGGVQTLEQYLVSLGLGADIAGWDLLDIADINPAGTVMVGRAMNPSGDIVGYRVELDEAPDCVADLDGDSIVDFSDLLILLTGWGVCP